MREILNNMVKPDYENSIVNLSNWILQNFGKETHHKPLDLPVNFEKIGLIIIDAFGYIAFEKMKRFYFPKNLPNPEKITSIFPSTTTAALTSIYTAKTPAEHGMIGYILFLKEYGFLVNMIELTPIGYERDALKDRMEFKLPVTTIFEELNGIERYVISPARYGGSGLSLMLHRGAKVVGYTSIGDFVFKFRDILAGEGKKIVVGYIPNVDGVGHKEREKAYINEASMILRQIDNMIAPKIPENAALAVTADHGMIRTPESKEIWLGIDSEIMKYLLMPPGGERRMMHLYTKNPDALLNYLEENYSTKGVFLKKEEAIELFGGNHERIGDVVLIASENYSFNFKYRFKEDSLAGMHGGLSEEEMYVPLFFISK
ncbi:MAG: alkaline phosphatase family protein [Thermotogaceae bacterium]|nr:alkaline phosphatase family protein [Thermotogaceae bacterium]